MAATMTRLNASSPLRSGIPEVAAIYKQSQQQREVVTAAIRNGEFKTDKMNNTGNSRLTQIQEQDCLTTIRQQ